VTTASKRRPRTNQERVEESTLALVASAIELFARQGYERTTAAEIGTNAGFSRNMVRDRYGSKDALLQSVFEAFAELLLPAVRRERVGTGLDHVLSQLDDLLHAVEREPETMRAMIVLTFETPGPLQSFAGWFDRLIAGYEAELAEHLAAGQADGSVRGDLDPDFVSYSIGLCFRSVLRRDSYDFAGEIKAFRRRIAAFYAA
jgi:AcrR family transcriptional regulator